VLDSVRSRLALWHTAALAVLLISFAIASDLWLERVVARREDRFLEETTRAFRANVLAELAEGAVGPAFEQSLADFRLRNVSFTVVDTLGQVIARTLPAVDGNMKQRSHGRARDQGYTGVPSAVRAAPREGLLTIGSGDDARRLFVLPVWQPRMRFTIIAAELLADQQELLEDTRAGFLIAIPLAPQSRP